jgi:hydroxyacylglutathione hydrolase
VRIRQFVIPGLGHLSTLIEDDASGLAAVVDPRRDVDAYLAAAGDGVRISHVIETHLHNDYVSGGRDLAAITGATHVIGVGADLAYEHRPVRHGDRFDLGGLRFTALETPGHTPEHMSYAVADTSRAEEPLLLFTGGSLLVGAVGRTDLLGEDHAVPYARAMFRSLHEVLLPHEDFVGVYPTHGAGSLCSTGIASTPSSTIGFERRYNPMIQPAEVEEFVRVLLHDQPAFPHYFARMRPINKAGPRLLGGHVPDGRPIAVEEVPKALAGDTLLVDARDPVAHADAHVPGSVSIPAGPSFGTWLGWVVDPDRPLLLLLGAPDQWDDLIRQALRIGYEHVVGYMAGGMDAWRRAGLPTQSTASLTADELAGRLASGGPRSPLVIDVRQASEFDAGHVPGSFHIRGGDLTSRLDDLPRDRPIATICASGYRSSIAASLLRRAGFVDVSWVSDGVPSWRAQGHPVDMGDAALAVGAVAEVVHQHDDVARLTGQTAGRADLD